MCVQFRVLNVSAFRVFRRLHELRGTHAQSRGGCGDGVEGRRVSATIEQADVGHVEPSAIGQRLLGEACVRPEGPDREPKARLEGGSIRHAPSVG